MTSSAMRVAGLAALTLFSACRGVHQAERQAVLAWLTCSPCDNGERSAVDSIGRRAVTILMEPLDTSTEGWRRLVRGLKASMWRSAASLPTPPADSAAYVNAYVTGVLTSMQVRAAISMGDVGAVSEIQEALDEQAERGLAANVVQALETALVQATSGTPPPADSVVVIPAAFELEVGRTMTMSALVLDQYGTARADQPVAWVRVQLPDSSVNVADDGRVFAMSPGVDTITATDPATGKVGRGIVTVVEPSPQPSLSVVSGNRQSGVAGSVLSAPVVIRAQTPDGTPAAAIPVAWQVAAGGGILVDAQFLTHVDGTARARWVMGPLVGTQRLTVTGPRNLPLRLLSSARAYSGPSGIVGCVLVDGAASLPLEVQASNGSASVNGTTDNSGRFFLPVQDTGSYTVSASLIRYGLPSVHDDVRVTADSPLVVVALEATLSPGAIGGGLFIDHSPRDDVYQGPPDEGPLNVANMTLELRGPSGTLTTRTAADGTFTFNPLPVGTYTVRLVLSALPAGMPGGPYVFGGKSTTRVVAVSAGGVTRVYFPFDHP